MSRNRPHLFPDLSSSAAACARFILDQLREAVDERGGATLAVSGGHTPKKMFEHMRQEVFPWEQLQFFFVDERSVPPTDTESNFGLVNEHFFLPSAFPLGNIHRIQGELPAQEAVAQYENDIRTTFMLRGDALPIFDVIQHGMGPDGHTASLFPGDPLIADRSGIAAAVRAPKPPPERITLLPGVLLVSRSTVFLVDGADKSQALSEVLTGALALERFPSQLVARSGKQVDWFLSDIRWPEAESAS